MHVGITQSAYVQMLGIEQGAYTAELTKKRDKVQRDHLDQEKLETPGR